MFADIHSHLLDKAFDETRNDIIKRFSEDGVAFAVENATCLKDCFEASELASENENIFCAVGIHPEFADSFDCDTEKELESLILSNDKIVAVGEIGLDYHYDDSPSREIQIKCFERQIALAERIGLPIVVHSRDASDDTMNVLKNSRANAVLHCYSGSTETALKYMDMGYYISFGGVLTFKKTKKQVAVLKSIPSDRILTETDCPYMAPEPVRGTVNEPSNIRYIIEKMAELMSLSYEETEKLTLDNALRFYGIDRKL